MRTVITSDPPKGRAMSVREIELFCQRVLERCGTTDCQPIAITRISGGIKSMTCECED